MSLIDKLAGINTDENISAHTFYAALKELHYGEITRANIISFFGLEVDDGNGVDEQAELDVIIAKYQSINANRRIEFLEFLHALFMIARLNPKPTGYATRADLNARLQRF